MPRRPIAMPLTLPLLAISLSACASLPAGRQPDPSDPFERYNRAAFSFNDAVDTALFKPIAKAYRFVTPDLAQQGVSNFFGNLSDVPTALNKLLQGKPNLRPRTWRDLP